MGTRRLSSIISNSTANRRARRATPAPQSEGLVVHSRDRRRMGLLPLPRAGDRASSRPAHAGSPPLCRHAAGPLTPRLAVRQGQFDSITRRQTQDGGRSRRRRHRSENSMPEGKTGRLRLNGGVPGYLPSNPGSQRDPSGI